MKRELAKKMSYFQGLDFNYSPCNKVTVVSDVVNDPLDSVLREIFTTDPVSGFPTGDIQYYMSKDGNPMVKDWLEKNLLMPRQKPVNNVEYDDDLVFEMSKKSDESFDDYRARILDIVNKSVEFVKPE